MSLKYCLLAEFSIRPKSTAANWSHFYSRSKGIMVRFWKYIIVVVNFYIMAYVKIVAVFVFFTNFPPFFVIIICWKIGSTEIIILFCAMIRIILIYFNTYKCNTKNSFYHLQYEYIFINPSAFHARVPCLYYIGNVWRFAKLRRFKWWYFFGNCLNSASIIWLTSNTKVNPTHGLIPYECRLSWLLYGFCLGQ